MPEQVVRKLRGADRFPLEIEAMERIGIEPMTFGLQSRRSPS